MAQLNLNLTPEFERDLAEFMKRRNIPSKSEAIRTAVKEGLQISGPKRASFASSLGVLKQTVKNPKFKTDDDLW